MRDDLRAVIERIRAAPGRIRAAPGVMIAATVGAIIATFVLALVTSNLRSEQPYLQMIRVSLQPTPLSASGTYLDVDVAVGNAGTATAKGCYAKAYNHLLFSEEIDESTELGRSEQFDLSPHGGHVPSVRVYPAGLSGEAVLGGGVRGPVSFRVECENGESPEEVMTVKVSGPAPGSAVTGEVTSPAGETTGGLLPGSGGLSVGSVLLPAAALLVGSGVLAYAVLRRRR